VIRLALALSLTLAGCLGPTPQDTTSNANARVCDSLARDRLAAALAILAPDAGTQSLSVEQIQRAVEDVRAARADVRCSLAETCAIARRAKAEPDGGCP